MLLIVLERRSRGRARFHVASNLRQNAGPSDLAGWRAAAAGAACTLPVLLGFVVPALHLFQLASRSDFPLAASALLRDAMHSLLLAAVAAVVIVALALFLSYAGRLVRRRALNR